MKRYTIIKVFLYKIGVGIDLCRYTDPTFYYVINDGKAHILAAISMEKRTKADSVVIVFGPLAITVMWFKKHNNVALSRNWSGK
jgi:hypothetical protein